jgi:hypothetical protein
MAQKALIAFLIKIFPLFLLILFLWQFLRFSHLYHSITASILNVFFPSLDPTGIVEGFASDGTSFIVKLAKGKILNIVGEDITSNTAMLFSLYLASPIRHRVRKFIKFFLASIFILLTVHCFTVSTMILSALAQTPQVLRNYSIELSIIRAADNYILFYELIGMYVIILALWFPYIGSCLVDMKNQAVALQAEKQKHPE